MRAKSFWLVVAVAILGGSASSRIAIAGESDDQSGAVAGPATTAAAAPDKSIYTLFNPTPNSQLRAFCSDRPSVTENPYTVDAGHIQVESSFAEYTYAKSGDTSSTEWSVAPTEFRVGLLNTVEFGTQFQPYLNLRTNSAGQANRADGVGNLDLHLKIALWGDDGGTTAFGIVPHITVPTADRSLGDGHVEGGVIFTYAATLPKDWALNAMIEPNIVRNTPNDGYGAELVYAALLSHPLVGPLSAYAEYVGIVPFDLHEAHQAYIDGGVTWQVNANLQLDVGIDKGLTRGAFDFDVFSGIAWRW